MRSNSNLLQVSYNSYLRALFCYCRDVHKAFVLWTSYNTKKIQTVDEREYHILEHASFFIYFLISVSLARSKS